MALPSVREWLLDQPFHLALSAGFFGFFAHTGLLLALEELELRPRSISGSSAGALAGGAWAAGLPAAALQRELARLQRKDFWDPAPGLGLLRGELFHCRLERLLPVNCFEQTRIPFQASVFDLRTLRTLFVDQGPLAPAVCASCALPGLFQPVRLKGHPCVDGGVADRAALANVRIGTRTLYHHLAGQSPWRTGPPAVAVRPSMISLVLSGLTRPGPFHLERGATAIEEARTRSLALLQSPIGSSQGLLLSDQGR